MRIFAISLILAAFLTAHAGEVKSAWTIESLTGKSNSFQGANCITSVLTVKGFDDELAYSGQGEMRYFLKRFCTPHAGPALPGDVIALWEGDYFAHTAIALEEGKIFEKVNSAGRFDCAENCNLFYEIKNLNESPWLGNLSVNDRHKIVYTCQDFAKVRAQTKTCAKRAEKMGIKTIRQEFQKLTLATTPEFSLSQKALDKMDHITNSLRETSTSDPCFLYFDVMTESVAWGIANFSARMSKLANHKGWSDAQFRMMDAFMESQSRLVKENKATSEVRQILGMERMSEP